MRFICAALLIVACDERAAGGEGEGEAEGEGAAEDTLSVAIGPIMVGPGVEDTRCVVLELESDDRVHVVAIEAQLSATSHHLIFYRVPQDTPLVDTPVSCDPFEGVIDGDAPLFIAQNAKQRLDMPAGVALPLEGRQRVRIEMHYLNTSVTDTATADGAIVLHTTPAAKVTDDADLLFYGTAPFVLPPLQETTIGPDFWTVPDGASVVAMTGHTHRLGTGMRIERAASSDGPGETVYDHAVWNWEEPPLDVFDPPLEFAAGEGLRWTCFFDNWTTATVTFGESALAEMCFLWAYYFPATEGFDTHVEF